jgi:hypothetical protein
MVRAYLLILGGGLLLEGGLLLLMGVLRVSMPFATGDPRHNTLHVVWGSLILAVLLLNRGLSGATWLAIVFGVFYSALAVAGLVIHQPFGLLLGPGENAFHFLVGPLALVLGLRAAFRASRRQLLARPAAPPHPPR